MLRPERAALHCTQIIQPTLDPENMIRLMRAGAAQRQRLTDWMEKMMQQSLPTDFWAPVLDDPTPEQPVGAAEPVEERSPEYKVIIDRGGGTS